MLKGHLLKKLPLRQADTSTHYHKERCNTKCMMFSQGPSFSARVSQEAHLVPRGGVHVSLKANNAKTRKEGRISNVHQ